MFRNVVWSTESCTLREFVDKHPLPQLVKVETGLYSNDDARTLSAEQILTLHFTKRTDKVLLRAAENKQYFLPLAYPYKVEILPNICEDTYYSVEDIVDASAARDFKFIRVVHNGPPLMRIRAGDILELKKTAEENRVKFLQCEFYNKTRDFVRLPLDFKAAFEPLADPKQHYLQEVVELFKLPVRVKFVSCDTIVQDPNNDIDLQSLGSLLVREVRKESTVIATSRDDDIVTVLMIPFDLDVKVNPALGALTGDKNYTRFCREIHDGTELKRIDQLKNSKLLDFSEEPTVDVADVYDYVEVGPPVPPRLDSKTSEHSDSDEDYEKVNKSVPPPRPPKPQPEPRVKSHHENEQQDDVSPSKGPSNFEQAPPNSDDDDHDEYDDDDEFDDDSADEDYVFYENEQQDDVSPSNFEEASPNNDDDSDYLYPVIDAPQAEFEQNCSNPTNEPQRATIRTRLSNLFKMPKAKSSPPSAQLFPTNLSGLSVSEVGECLRKLNMGEHVETFENHQIDGELFLAMDEQTLTELEVSKFQRQKLLRFIHGWRPKID